MLYRFDILAQSSFRRWFLAATCLFGTIAAYETEAAPVITDQPAPTSVVAGKNAVIRVTATGDNPTYQWFHGAAGDTSLPVSGATGPLFVSPPLRSATSFWVQASDSTGVTNSQTAPVAMGRPQSARLFSFGYNSDGQLGDGTRTDRNTPTSVTSEVAEVVAGEYHSFFIKTDGSLWAMGDNGYGQLGDGTTYDSSIPIQISTDVISATTGTRHTLFIKSDFTLWAMGRNDYGQLGDGTNNDQTVPVQVAQDVVSVAAGSESTFFIKSDGTLWAMGRNHYGQLGDGTLDNRADPVQISTSVIDVSAGEFHSLFVKVDGTLWSAGHNEYGQLGNGTTTGSASPHQVASGVARVTAGRLFSLSIRTDGSLWAMGNNASGKFGNGTTTNASAPVKVLEDVVFASAGYGHSLFLKSNRSLWAAGNNFEGQLGDGTRTNRFTAVQIRQDVSVVAAGGYHSLIADLKPSISTQPTGSGITAGGSTLLTVSATGSDLSYQWFSGTSGDTRIPVAGAVAATFTTPPAYNSVNYWVRISSSYGSIDSQTVQVELQRQPNITLQREHRTASYGEPAVLETFATGGYLTYQWYRGATGETSTPVPGATGSMLITIPSQTDTRYWVRVSNAAGSSDSRSAHVTIEAPVPSRLFGTGSNFNGQLGTGTNVGVTTPLLIATRVTHAAAGSQNSFFIRDNGDLWATGMNDSGQLGDGFTTDRFIPTKVAGEASQVKAGLNHTLVIKTDNTLWSMGSNSYGQLGDGTSTSRPTPVAVADEVVQVAAGTYHSLFVKSDGSLWGMGYNEYGQLGDGTTTSRSTPVHIADSVAMAAAGGGHSLFLKTDGTLWAMGYNRYGQLCNGLTANSLTPVQVASDVIRVTAGWDNSFFIQSNNWLWVVGSNESGALGVGHSSIVPIPVIASYGDRAVAPGRSHSLRLLDKTLLASGSNSNGQLGDGTYTNRPYAVEISNSVTSIAAGEYHSLYLDSKPSIELQPIDVGMVSGDTTGFSVSVSGRGPISYQWYSGNSGDISKPVAGATMATYIPSITADGTSYWVRATTADGTVDSKAAMLYQITQPIILTHSPGSTVAAGENAVLKASATGGMLNYQWFNGLPGDVSSPVAGATGPLFVSSPLTTGGSFWVRISNQAGATDSTTIPVTVTPPVSGYLRAAGLSTLGQLGSGASTRFSPAPILFGVAKVSSSADHTLVLKTDGSLWKIPPNNFAPVQITTGVTWIASDPSRSAFVKSDGTVWVFSSSSTLVPTQVATGASMAWPGSQSIHYLKTNGELVRKTAFSMTAPESFISSGVVSASFSTTHYLFIKTNGTLWGAGSNTYGQLGARFDYVARQISSDVVKAAAGPANTYFVKNDGTLWGMGINTYRQLGSLPFDLPSGTVSYPVGIDTGVADVSTTSNHVMFVKTDGSLWGVGLNSSGQLGDGTSVNRSSPVLMARQVSQVAAGSSNTFFVTTDGTLWGTGSNQYSQFGPATPAPALPLQVSDQVIAISAGASHSLILKADGTLWASGSNEFGQLGDGTQMNRSIPTFVASNVASASAGITHSLFVKTDGSLWATGNNANGQFGNGTSTSSPAPVQVDSGVALAKAGNRFSLVIKTDGTLWSMGTNISGQLGDRTDSSRYTRVQVAAQVVTAAAGDNHSLFLKNDGTLWGMGDNRNSQLGIPGLGNYFDPVRIATEVTRIEAGSKHSSFIKSDGTLWSVGDNSFGQLGDGTNTKRLDSVEIATAVADLSAGNNHGLFVKTDGTLWANGSNSSSKLGDGTIAAHLAPVQVDSAVVAASAGTDHSLWITTTAGSTVTAIGNHPISTNVAPGGSTSLSVTAIGSGTLSYQWYSGLSGDTSLPLPDADSANFTTPAISVSSNFWVRITSASGTADSQTAGINVLGAPTITSHPVLAGRLPTGGVRLIAAGSADAFSYQWYSSTGGTEALPVPGGNGPTLLTLPLGTTTGFWIKVTNSSGSAESQRITVSPEPEAGRYLKISGSSFNNTLIQKTGAVTSVSTGALHTLLVKTSGSLWALGNNSSGQFGNGTTQNSSTPVFISDHVSTASAGTNHSLFVKTDGTLWAMGLNNYGQLGDGTITPKITPVFITHDVTSVAAGDSHSLFIKTDGTLWAMGRNNYRQLGDNTGIHRRSPVQIASSVVMAAAGFGHSLFLKTDGSLWGMGLNADGQLSSPLMIATSPAKIADNVVSISAGNNHSLFVSADGTLRGMGRNDRGHVGYGATDSDWASFPYYPGYPYTPVRPNIITVHATMASAGGLHSLWTKNDGSLWASGVNTHGQLLTPSTQPAPPAKSQDRIWVADAGGNNSAILTTNSALEPPVILTHPVSAFVSSGATATFSISASGPSLNYQWYNGVSGNMSQPISGATGPTYTTDALMSDTQVWVKVANSAAYSESRTAIALIGGQTTTYQEWVESEGLAEGDASPGSDPDGDSRSNLLEYATGTSANHSDSSPLVRVTTDSPASNADFHVKLRRDPTLRYTCQLTADLVTWMIIPLEFKDGQWIINDVIMDVSNATPGEENLWDLTLRPYGNDEKLFMKITVEK